MKTLIVQSYRTENVPNWIARCLKSVEDWANSIEAEYRFYDDRIFDLLPDWYRQKSQSSVTVATDLARLLLTRKHLNEGYDRVFWIDADMIVFNPDFMNFPTNWPFAFCREVWISPQGGDQLSISQKTNNALCFFTPASLPFIEQYIGACEWIVRSHNKSFQGAEVGTDYLTANRDVMNIPTLRNIGLFSPALMAEIANSSGLLGAHYINRMESALGAANLCASVAGGPSDGINMTPELYEAVIDKLLETKGQAINRWANYDVQFKVGEHHLERNETDSARQIFNGLAKVAANQSEPLTKLAEIALLQNRLVSAFSNSAEALRRNPFDNQASEINKTVVPQMSDLTPVDIFSQIYQTSAWGSTEAQPYFSGPGSAQNNRHFYCEYVNKFIKDHDIKTVVDLGCGDFSVGSQIVIPEGTYTGVDIFKDLIDYNQKTFGNDRIQFTCKDIIEDDLPTGELCLIRQVLQHLSNDDILKLLQKLKQYQYVLISDGQAPIELDKRKNFDKPTGMNTRGNVFNNGLWLELPPFNLDLREVLTYRLKGGVPEGEELRTVLLTHQWKNCD